MMDEHVSLTGWHYKILRWERGEALASKDWMWLDKFKPDLGQKQAIDLANNSFEAEVYLCYGPLLKAKFVEETLLWEKK